MINEMEINGNKIIVSPTNTTEAMLKELKLLLDEYERKIKESERNILTKNNFHSQKDNSMIKYHFEELDKIKGKIEKCIMSISPIISKEDQKFILNKYKEKKEHLYAHHKNISKQINKLNDSKKLSMLINKKDSDIDTKGITILNEENDSLHRCLKISDSMNSMGKLNEEELGEQSKILNNNHKKVLDLLNRIPYINSVLNSIKFHKYKEKLILGIVIGMIIFFGLYLTFY